MRLVEGGDGMEVHLAVQQAPAEGAVRRGGVGGDSRTRHAQSSSHAAAPLTAGTPACGDVRVIYICWSLVHWFAQRQAALSACAPPTTQGRVQLPSLLKAVAHAWLRDAIQPAVDKIKTQERCLALPQPRTACQPTSSGIL